MRRMVFRSVLKLADGDPVEVFWLTGFDRTDRNEWKVRVVYRNMRTGEITQVYEPIGMLPILSLGTRFEHGVLKTDGLPGERWEVIIPNVGAPEIITSAQLPSALYALPEGRSGNQYLFRYETAVGSVIIPAIELIRVLFGLNRSMALALMRPAGLEQLIVPMVPGNRDLAELGFTKEMPKSAIGHDLALDVAWIAMSRDARRSWDSVRRLSQGQNYALLDPPVIRNSVWSFRGVRVGKAWFVLELQYVGGRELPFRELQYSHPGFRKVVAPVTSSGSPGPRTRDVGEEVLPPSDDYDVDDGEQGSASYQGALTSEMLNRRLAFESDVQVVRIRKEVDGQGRKATSRAKKPSRKGRGPVKVTTGERAGQARIPPLEFKTLASSPSASTGDLVALDETVRHMRDMLPDATFSMALVELKRGGAAVASVGSRPRVGMVVTIRVPGEPLIAVIDIERSGIAALSLMSMHFVEETEADQVEGAIQMMLNGWSDCGGHWSSEVERQLGERCRCERLPRAIVPREKYSKFGAEWANRLIWKLNLQRDGG